MCTLLNEFIEHSKIWNSIYIDPVLTNEIDSSLYKIHVKSTGELIGTGDIRKNHINIRGGIYNDYKILYELSCVQSYVSSKGINKNMMSQSRRIRSGI